MPTTDWDMVEGENNFAPSTWAKGVTSPDWQPESAFNPEDDQLKTHESQWQKGIMNPEWTPTDAWGKSNAKKKGTSFRTGTTGGIRT